MNTVISKLPFKMKELWRNKAYEILIRTGRRARFSDLVDFINWQAKVCNDPVFGHILDVSIEGKGKPRQKDNIEITEATSTLIGTQHERSRDTGAGEGENILPIGPVKLKSKRSNKVIQIYAFLDQGSTATFCTEDVMQQLNLRGRGTRAELLLTTMGSEKKVSSRILSDLEVCGVEEESYMDFPQTFTQPSIPVKKENIPLQKDIEQWPYLHDVRIVHIEAESVCLLVLMLTRPMNLCR